MTAPATEFADATGVKSKRQSPSAKPPSASFFPLDHRAADGGAIYNATVHSFRFGRVQMRFLISGECNRLDRVYLSDVTDIMIAHPDEAESLNKLAALAGQGLDAVQVYLKLDPHSLAAMLLFELLRAKGIVRGSEPDQEPFPWLLFFIVAASALAMIWCGVFWPKG